uniref:Mannose-P-dolichol utilization defect 1 protein homolog n=1 Tax=Albugo laibachii Nc14 TaxID=890382 RepID=F0WT25_9STRA|nr:mannosePdolichol utilization defect 1 protein putati [Albugo laibachii Nc14]|eukprot:CCA24511.1 mannosePdolichol utilization defect 1 protein putati [Albugo laibachii Nc14]
MCLKDRVTLLVLFTIILSTVLGDSADEHESRKYNFQNATESDFMLTMLTPECYTTILLERNFLHIGCLKLLVSKLLGFAIIGGSLILKLPQIVKILAARDVTGLTPASFYLEVILYLSGTIYNILREYPISTWGENLVILVQNLILVLLIFTFHVPRISISMRSALSVLFGVLASGMYNLPSEYQWILPSAAIPITIFARAPQVYTNYKHGHTGQLAFLTLLLNFGGSVARLFTTLQETGDLLQLTGYSVAICLNGILVVQVFLYWNATNKALLRKKKL